MTKRYTSLHQYTLLFFLISFFGWGIEMLYCLARTGRFADRGFLTLPFCTIYGFSILSIYALIGTPQNGRFLLKKCTHRRLRYPCYFLLAMLIPTLMELVTAAALDHAFAIRLWDYHPYPLDLWGYICLPLSFAWGVLITLFMAFCFPPLQRLIERIPSKTTCVLGTALSLAVIADWIVCFVKIFSRL